MLRELIEYYLTPTTVEAKQSGYLYEAMAFQAKGRRNKKHWLSHWQACHEQVIQFLEKHSHAQSIVIFGSGCLFEIPKDFLLGKMENIVLVDHVFPLSVRAWARKNKNKVQLIERDLTQNFPSELNCDLVVSANLLSQLTLIAEDPKGKAVLEQKHLADLRALKKPVLLWTDVERFYLDAKSGDKLEQEKTVFSPLPQPLHEWLWEISPAPETDARLNISLKVQSFVW